MDNPISWGILLLLAILAAVWFWQKCEAELSQNKREQEKFWEDWEN